MTAGQLARGPLVCASEKNIKNKNYTVLLSLVQLDMDSLVRPTHARFMQGGEKVMMVMRDGMKTAVMNEMLRE